MPSQWYKVADVGELVAGRVATVIAGVTPVCLIHTKTHGYTALDNRCPHQGGPLGEGQIDGRWLICPWHGYEYDPATGEPPEGYGDCATPYRVEVRGRAVWVQVDEQEHSPTVSDQLVGVMTDWGVDAVFGMVGHSNLGFADALRRAGGFGQYLADFTTAVKYNMPICVVLLNNGELGKISKEQRAERLHVWQTSLHNPNFAEFARLCGGYGFRATRPDEVAPAIAAGLATAGPAIVEILTDPMQT